VFIAESADLSKIPHLEQGFKQSADDLVGALKDHWPFGKKRTLSVFLTPRDIVIGTSGEKHPDSDHKKKVQNRIERALPGRSIVWASPAPRRRVPPVVQDNSTADPNVELLTDFFFQVGRRGPSTPSTRVHRRSHSMSPPSSREPIEDILSRRTRKRARSVGSRSDSPPSTFRSYPPCHCGMENVSEQDRIDCPDVFCWGRFQARMLYEIASRLSPEECVAIFRALRQLDGGLPLVQAGGGDSEWSRQRIRVLAARHDVHLSTLEEVCKSNAAGFHRCLAAPCAEDALRIWLGTRNGTAWSDALKRHENECLWLSVSKVEKRVQIVPFCALCKTWQAYRSGPLFGRLVATVCSKSSKTLTGSFKPSNPVDDPEFDTLKNCLKAQNLWPVGTTTVHVSRVCTLN